MNVLKILSGGAAEGLIKALAPQFEKQTGYTIDGTFGAVGTMADLLRGGANADIVVLTSAVLDRLSEDKLLRPGAPANIGIVETAIAVRNNERVPPIGSADALRDAFLQADAIFVPDTKASTAGMHIAKVFAQLGVADRIAARLREFPNGATAMRNLASFEGMHGIGCTQTTEILITPGLHLVGPLPKELALATMYAAAITERSNNVLVAQKLIGLLTADANREIRTKAGFLSSLT